MIFKHNKSSETTSTSNAPERCLASLQTNDLETNIKEPSLVFNQPISSLLLNIVSRATVYRNAQLEKCTFFNKRSLGNYSHWNRTWSCWRGNGSQRHLTPRQQQSTKNTEGTFSRPKEKTKGTDDTKATIS